MATDVEEGDSIEKMFSVLRDQTEADRALKDEINGISRQLEFCEREIVVILDRTHLGNGNVSGEEYISCEEIIEANVKPLFEKLKLLISPDVYYKFHDAFRYAVQRTIFAIAFLHYLKEGKLISRDRVAKFLRLEVDGKKGFHLDLEDYLHGVLCLTSELARFTVNSVSSGDNQRPFQIANFVRAVDASFRLLNLKNDSLRKRFDALKYDLQRCDQVVYDLTIRGMKPIVADEKGDYSRVGSDDPQSDMPVTKKRK